LLLKGNQRGGARDLALHLLKDENDHVEIYELRGFMSDDLVSALKEIYLIGKSTRAKKILYSMSINPPENKQVSTEDFLNAIERAEKKLGLKGQARAIVFHEKEGRRHAHCVWSRIDARQMKAIHISHDKLKLFELSRELFLERGWELPPGMIDRSERDPLQYTMAQLQQAKRIEKRPHQIKTDLQSCWASSDNKSSFEQALKERGYYLARGDRRGFVALDHFCEIYSLGKKWLGVSVKDIRARIGDESKLRSVEETRTLIAQEMRAHLSNAQDEQGSAIEARKSLIKDQLKLLVSKQRRERRELTQAQDQRFTNETHHRQARFKTGLKGILARATGQHRRTMQQNARDTALAKQRDQFEKDELVFNHIEQRRGLKTRLQRLDKLEKTNADNLAKDSNQYEEIERGLRDIFKRRQDKTPLITDPLQSLIIPVDEAERGLAQRIKHSPNVILGVLSDKQESFTYNEIVNGLKKYIEDPVAVNAAIKQVLASKELVELEKPPKALYSTNEMQNIKAALLHDAGLMNKARGHGVIAKYQDSAIDKHNQLLRRKVGANLSDEQSNAVRHVLNDKQISIAIGLAGTGKSTMLAAANDAWRSQDRRVFGAALSGKAADGLQEASGIQSRTLASWQASWKHGYHELKRGDVLVIDEAGMIGNRQMLTFIEHAHQCGAKLVLVGDPEQLQPINAGTPLREIAKKIGHADLTEVRRQKEIWQKQASLDFAQKRTDKAIQAYAEHGAVYESKDKNAAVTTLVEDYMSNLETHDKNASRIALAYRRKDVHKINQYIRAARHEKGHLSDEREFKTDHGIRKFSNDDRIVFTKNDKELDVRNGMLGTVRAVTSNKVTVEFDADGSTKPRRLTFSPSEYSAFDHGYATTIHKSQGVTVDHSFVLSAGQMDRHLTYVAMTRHKDSAKLYVDKSRNKNTDRNTDDTMQQRDMFKDIERTNNPRGPSRGR
jgi:Ti-type conjugative transfer relaxase TraA